MKKNELGELLATIERLREEKFSDISSDLVAQIIMLEDKFFDERTLVQREIERLVDSQASQGNVE